MSAAHISDDHDPVCASEVIDIFEAQIGEGVVSENPLGKTGRCRGEGSDDYLISSRHDPHGLKSWTWRNAYGLSPRSWRQSNMRSGRHPTICGIPNSSDSRDDKDSLHVKRERTGL